MSGRASRGRARGRARGGDQAPGAGRPGEGAAQVPVAAPPAQPPPAATGPPPPSGRASYRGGAREAVPGGGGDIPQAPVEAMARMRVGTGDVRDIPPGRRPYRFTEPATRPAHIVDKKGASGNMVPLQTNYFKLQQANPDSWLLYQYHVDYNPELGSKSLRVGLLGSLSDLVGPTRAFDGQMLYLPFKLQEQETVRSVTTKQGTHVQITIKLTNELPAKSPLALQVFNIIFKRILNHLGMKQVNRNYFWPEMKKDIPQHKLEVWPGFTTSILQYETSVLLCADIAHKIMRSDFVLDILYELYERDPNNFYNAAYKKLVGSIVLTKYNNNTYRISDIDLDQNPLSTFKKRDGSSITYKEYYREHYGQEITDETQPLLVTLPSKKDVRAGRTEKIYLIPALCSLTGLSEEVRADFHVMKDVAVHTRVPPADRSTTLETFMGKILSNQKARDELNGWNLSFGKSLLTLNGRALPQEKITQKNAELSYRREDADWSRDMRGKKLIMAVDLLNWIMIAPRRAMAQANDLSQTLCKVGSPMGMRINAPKMIELADDRTDAYLRGMRENLMQDTQLVLTVVTTNKKDRYDAIKKFCCVDHPVPSQVVVQKTLNKKQMLMSVATKIAIQLNCKLGGEVWALEIPLRNLMVVGIDSYHDSSQKGRSVGGLVCSVNHELTRYYSRCTFQHNAQELMDGICVCLQAGLRHYHQVNGQLPDRIIIFRDGVGDGQLEAVSSHEVPQVNECFKTSLGRDYCPKVGFVVVKKRINSRFFTRSGPGMVNPAPGTVIDSEVTKPEWYDFFLISQSVRQGTVTPTHYNVIWDTTGLKPDHMQRLSYKLTHLYYNWPGTVRVPAPCQYAHKLSFLVGQSIHRDPALDLADRLFYL